MIHEKFKALSDENHDIAKNLAATGRAFISCYYHVGFSLELLIKACRARSEGMVDWPVSERGAKWHQLSFLIDNCGLRSDLRKQIARNSNFRFNWATVKDWDAVARYGVSGVTEQDARDILQASANPNSGVRPWLLEIYNRS